MLQYEYIIIIKVLLMISEPKHVAEPCSSLKAWTDSKKKTQMLSKHEKMLNITHSKHKLKL